MGHQSSSSHSILFSQNLLTRTLYTSAFNSPLSKSSYFELEIMMTHNLIKSGSGIKIIPQHADLRHDRDYLASTSVAILFVRQIVQRFRDKESGVLIGEPEIVVDKEKELLVNHHFFFQIQHESNACAVISALLDDFIDVGIKKSLHNQVVGRVLKFGRQRKRRMSKNKNKYGFLDGVVSLISIETFLVDGGCPEDQASCC